MKHKIIQTKNYLLVVDDSEININQYVYCDLGYIEKVMDIINGWIYHTNTLGKNPINHYKKIIAHLPLNNSPILDSVDLLPPLEDDEVEKLAMDYATKELNRPIVVYKLIEANVSEYKSFIKGYNKAKEKYKYTEDDIKNGIVKGFLMGMDREHNITEVVEQIIQSLQQPKMPVGFDAITIDNLEETTTNSQGLTQWVGKYIF
jgi:hypothetical protein